MVHITERDDDEDSEPMGDVEHRDDSEADLVAEEFALDYHDAFMAYQGAKARYRSEDFVRQRRDLSAVLASVRAAGTRTRTVLPWSDFVSCALVSLSLSVTGKKRRED